MSEINKALILCANLDNKFLPLSKVVPKELWPLNGKPIIHHILQEVKNAGIKKAVIVLGFNKKLISLYFKKNLKLEKILEKSEDEQSLTNLNSIQEFQKDISISFITSEKPITNAQAILKAKTKLGKSPFVVLSCDSIFSANTPSILQLLKIFKTCGKPVIALNKAVDEDDNENNIVEIEKIANRLFKIRKIISNPSSENNSSNLIISGKYIFVPEIFEYLKPKKIKDQQEITLVNTLKSILKDGKIIYGYEIEGKWLSLKDKASYLQSNIYLSSKK
ncbi:MAG: hypothetical protein ISS87_02770 [Candidatus Pacebacteria bacterium]|nr:hypothetical protein [Candidatus Paceibacterota bacterium]